MSGTGYGSSDLIHEMYNVVLEVEVHVHWLSLVCVCVCDAKSRGTLIGCGVALPV